MLSVEDENSKKYKKKYKIFIGCGCFWFILGLLLFLAFAAHNAKMGALNSCSQTVVDFNNLGAMHLLREHREKEREKSNIIFAKLLAKTLRAVNILANIYC